MNRTRRLVSFALAVAAMARGISALAGDLHGFKRDKSEDLYGLYIPAADVQIGKFVLDEFAIGPPSDFENFETGRLRGKPYAPLMFEFSDVTSGEMQSETGAHYANAPRVLPDAYRLAGNTVRFSGTDRQLGTIVFSGTLDVAGIKAAQAGQATGTGADKRVLKGDLSVGKKTFKNVTFTWSGGD